MKGVTSIVGAVATDMGILTTPQLHWMVRAINKGVKASEQDYFEQLSSSFRLGQSMQDVVIIILINQLVVKIITGYIL